MLTQFHIGIGILSQQSVILLLVANISIFDLASLPKVLSPLSFGCGHRQYKRYSLNLPTEGGQAELCYR